jgi:hypothetical protein
MTLPDPAVASLLEKDAIREAIVGERRARDARDWDALSNFYTEDCTLDVSWFQGRAHDFIRASRLRVGKTRSFHYVWSPDVVIDGQRALAETPMEIHVRLTVKDVEVEITSHARLVTRMVKVTDGWKMASFDAIYRGDEARSLNPERPLPVAWHEIEAYRPSYRMLCWMMVSTGLTPDDERLGEDRPEAVASFLERAREWLRTKTDGLP